MSWLPLSLRFCVAPFAFSEKYTESLRLEHIYKARQMADGQLRGAMEEGGQGSRAFTAPRNSHTHWALCQCLCNALRVRGARQIPYFLARLVGLISHL